MLFVACLAVCLLVLAGLLWRGLSWELVTRGLWVAAGMFAYFLFFVVPLFMREKVGGKELVVGIFFALGAIAAIGYTTDALFMFPTIALIVAFNCLVIAARDAEIDKTNDPGGASRWWTSIDRDLPWIGGTFVLAFLLMAVVSPARTFFLAAAAAIAGLTVLQRMSRRFSADAVRALADFCLLTPWPALSWQLLSELLR